MEPELDIALPLSKSLVHRRQVQHINVTLAGSLRQLQSTPRAAPWRPAPIKRRPELTHKPLT